MLNKGWLPLNEYSAKYRISLSTLRRRIRGAEVEYRFDEGKYWLPDNPLNKPAHAIKVDLVTSGAQMSPAEISRDTSAVSSPASNVPAAEGILHSAQNLLQELKNAYVKVLHEKEEQVTQLKGEVVDLKTLVKILESDNDRLKSNLGEAAPIDSWLEENIER